MLIFFLQKTRTCSEDRTVFEIIKYKVDGTLYFLITSDQYNIYAIQYKQQNKAIGKHHIIFRGFLLKYPEIADTAL